MDRQSTPESPASAATALDADSRAWLRSLRAEGAERVWALEGCMPCCCGPPAGKPSGDTRWFRWAASSWTTSAGRPPTTQCRWVPFWATSRYAHVFIEDQGIEDQGQWRLASSQGTPIVGD